MGADPHSQPFIHQLNIAEEKLVSQTRASAAAAASAKQAQASLSQELGRRVKEVDGVREELSTLRERVESSDEEVAGLRAALEEREGRLISTEVSPRDASFLSRFFISFDVEQQLTFLAYFVLGI